MYIRFSLLFTILIISITNAQDSHPTHKFTHQDSLRGTITPERSWWDLTYYHLAITVDPTQQSLQGSNTIHYQVIDTATTLQIDLQAPLKIDKVQQNGQALSVRTDGNAHFIKLVAPQDIGSHQQITVYYSGLPRKAKNAPWDGGISWKKDTNGQHFIASSCQGLGASSWWPNKDHMYDEVDSMLVSVTVPKGLVNVSNGRLRSTTEQSDTTTYHWFVSNPINNYGVNINIGDYTHFSEVYAGEKGPLDMQYYVLKDHLKRAKRQFKDAQKMMKAFEHWFGPYPFYEDSYKLVEVPYLGMEHQSSVTYGNQYTNGYLGRDLSGTGWGLKFDFIIIHESGHEWFANNITNRDIADMWIHESFTAYSENLFLDYHYGTEAAAAYVIGTRKNIKNDTPIIGQYEVNHQGSGDMYYKGANMLHTLRQWVDNDTKWRTLLRGLNFTFYHQTVTTQQIENYIATKTGLPLIPFFTQYLRTTNIPTLEYKQTDTTLSYRYTHIVDGFEMPIRVLTDQKPVWIHPTDTWQSIELQCKSITIDPNFYIHAQRL